MLDPPLHQSLGAAFPDLRSLTCILPITTSLGPCAKLEKLTGVVIYHPDLDQNAEEMEQGLELFDRVMRSGHFPALKLVVLRVMDMEGHAETLRRLVRQTGLATSCSDAGITLQIDLLGPWELNHFR